MKWIAAIVLVVAGFPVAAEYPPEPQVPAGYAPELPSGPPHEPPGPPAGLADLPLSGTADISYGAFYRHVRSRNPEIQEHYLRELFEHYHDLASLEGVSLLVALAQMTHETNYLLFTGSVRAGQFNYAGIGATSATNPGNTFPDMRTGVAAHIQHLKAYANEEPLVTNLVNPRFHLVVRGVAPTVHGLTGRWATDPEYGRKVLEHARRLAGFE